ncbi:MAG: transcriptional repressor [Coriobacteriia bacterium]|nr:transcriptional repressor [Coriobacteriia bacterium]
MSHVKCRDTAFSGGRATSQRRAIVEVAESLKGAFTVSELAEAVRRHDCAMGTATVYRAVTALEASGWLERVGQRGESALFARCLAEDDHHHHLVCDGCGRVSATQCPLPGGSTAASTQDGFVITRHEVTLYGLCADCRRTDG